MPRDGTRRGQGGARPASEHGFSGDDIEAVTLTGTRRMVERHNILEPPDLMLAQYSIPFCFALALYREARDPESYDESALADPKIRALTRRVRLVPEATGGTCDGSTVSSDACRRATLRAPRGQRLSAGGELADKFTRLTRGVLGEATASALYQRLQRLETEPNLDWLGA